MFNKVKLFVLSTLIIFFITGCADVHKVVRTSSKQIKLKPNATAYISIPRDGRYGNKNYAGSGATTAQVILLAFSKYLTQVETGHEYQSYKEAFSTAQSNQVDYLIFPSILAWEDRATAWSGISDKVSVKISIISVRTTKTIDSAIISGKSGIATFGGDHPQDLLPEPIENYAKALFANGNVMN